MAQLATVATTVELAAAEASSLLAARVAAATAVVMVAVGAPRAAADPMVGGTAVAALVALREMLEAGPEAAAPMEAVEGSHRVAQAVAGGARVAAAMGVLVAAAASASSGR